MLNLKFAGISDPTANTKQTAHSATITMGYLDRLGQPQSQGEMKAG